MGKSLFKSTVEVSSTTKVKHILLPFPPIYSVSAMAKTPGRLPKREDVAPPPAQLPSRAFQPIPSSHFAGPIKDNSIIANEVDISVPPPVMQIPTQESLSLATTSSDSPSRVQPSDSTPGASYVSFDQAQQMRVQKQMPASEAGDARVVADLSPDPVDACNVNYHERSAMSYEGTMKKDLVGCDHMLHVVAAAIAPDDDDDEALMLAGRLEQQIKEEVKAQLSTTQTPVVAEVMTNFNVCSCQKNLGWIILLMLILIIGATVAGVLLYPKNEEDSPAQTKNITQSDDSPQLTERMALLQLKLEDWIIPTEEDLMPFADPTSPQWLALEWLSTDTISSSENISAEVILERYVLAVLYYSTNGPSWSWLSPQYLIQSKTCSWNNGDDLGIFCENLSGVTHIRLAQVNLAGTIPWELSLLSNLVTLDFDKNALEGTIPTQFGTLSNLETIWLASNLLNSSLPTYLPSSIQSLDLSFNSFHGRVPSIWGDNLFNVFELILEKNNLSGPLPLDFWRLTNLRFLSIHENSLTGSLPSELGQLTVLQAFLINDNKLTGFLPSELGQLAALTDFDVDKNALVGPLPSELGQLTNLLFLWVSNNILTGTVPTELGQVVSLLSLWVSGNSLTGTVPVQMALLINLTEFSFENNHLTGSVGEALCVNKSWVVLFSDCLDSGDGQSEINCTCCTDCCPTNPSSCRSDPRDLSSYLS